MLKLHHVIDTHIFIRVVTDIVGHVIPRHKTGRHLVFELKGNWCMILVLGDVYGV